MKVIDLLNKIANGEAPEKIKYDEDIYTYNKYLRDYEYFETGEDKYYSFIEHKICEINVLNEEVEVIEDKPKEDAYQRIKELEEENIMLRSAWDDMFKKWESQVNKVGKAIEYIGNGNIGIPTKTREKIIKILKAEEK